MIGYEYDWLTEEQIDYMNMDYEFCQCLTTNPQPFNLMDVVKIIAKIEGVNGNEDWHWLVLLKDKRFVYLRGGCCRDGFNCESNDCEEWAGSSFINKDKSLLTTIKEWQYDAGNGMKYTSPELLVMLETQLVNNKDLIWQDEIDQTFFVSNFYFKKRGFIVTNPSFNWATET